MQQEPTHTTEPKTRHRWRRLRRVGFALAVIALAVAVAFTVNPWPGAMMIRAVFESGAGNVKVAMEAHAPEGVSSILGEQYRANDGDAYLDVYFPDSVAQSGKRLPTLVWTHGGAWLSGNRDDAVPYFQLIAREGYTVVSLDYSLAPDHEYPRPVIQVNDALAYIQANADRLHIDPDRMAMAGDSAGAQITSQIAALVTNPDFAAEMGITPALSPDQLRGVVLFCGIYDLDEFMKRAGLASSILEWGTNVSIWAYTGKRGGNETAMAQMSTIDHLTSDYPPSFISGGNADPLTDYQSRPLADALHGQGVSVTTLFYPEDHTPDLPHEYQFNLDNADGQEALAQVLAFLDGTLGP